MAPPTTKPRIQDLNPEDVAEEAATSTRELAHYLARVSGTVLKSEDPVNESPMYRRTLELVKYAQKGTHLSDEGDFTRAFDIVAGGLFPGAHFSDGYPDGMDREGRVGVVLQAALARHRLQHKKAGVSFAELAALAGVSYRQVWNLADTKELKADDGIVPPADARRWLAAREVPGFER